MSHSDSEVPGNVKAKRKRLGELFKAKLRLPSNHEYKSRSLKHQLRPVLLDLRLISCVNTNNVDEVQRLLSCGVSANTTDIQNRSALHIAVSRGYKDIVKLLLQYGADPNKRDMIHNTPLHLAACCHNFAIISLLIDAGADVASLDMHGRHPLQLARSKLELLRKSWSEGHMEMINLRAEVKEVINLMIAVKNARERKKRSEEMIKLTIDSLENMRLTINTDEENSMENQMSQLLGGLENFQID